MNKKMRELLTKMEQKTNEAKSFMDGENKDIAKVNALMAEVEEMKAEYDAEEKLFNAEKLFNTGDAKKVAEEKKTKSEIEKFVKAVRDLAKGMVVEGVDADGESGL
jgi:hypothetical protein